MSKEIIQIKDSLKTSEAVAGREEAPTEEVMSEGMVANGMLII